MSEIVFTIELHVVEQNRQSYGSTVERVRVVEPPGLARVRLLTFVNDNIEPHLKSLQRQCDSEHGAASRARQAALYLLATQMTGQVLPIDAVRFEVGRCTDCDWEGK